MKDKINQLAKEIFEYEQPRLLLSVQQLNFDVEAGQVYEGSFTIRNAKGRMMKGIVTCSSPFMEIEKNQFQGIEIEVAFRFHGEYIRPGEYEQGVVSIISDCGEFTLPFMANIDIPSCNTSMGKIKDLFHFAGLAKEDAAEAVKLFAAPYFEEIFLYRDSKGMTLYRGLRKSTSAEQAMEEFLVAMHKKLPVHIKVDKGELSYRGCRQIFSDTVTITKDNWGYLKIEIETNAPFILPDYKYIRSDNFIGNDCKLQIEIDPSKMLPGKNYAELVLRTVNQEIVIPIVAERATTEDKLKEQVLRQDNECQLAKLYLDFRSNVISHERYIEKMEHILYGLDTVYEKRMLDLYRMHLCIMDERETAVGEYLERFESLSESELAENPLEHSAFLYLKALYTKDAEDITQGAKKVRYYYEHGNHTWQIFWLLLYLDKKYENSQFKVREILQHIEDGCHSPILYYEAVSVMNREPKLLHEMSQEMILCVNWAIKNNCLQLEAALHFTYLAGRMKKFHPLVFHCMEKLYETYRHDEMLGTICGILIRSGKTSEKYFKWFALGVTKKLRIAELFENYMYTMPEGQELSMPQQVLLYFTYENHLPAEKKELLYAYVCRHKAEDSRTYHSYYHNMFSYAMEALEKKQVNANLAVLYDEFLNVDLIDKKLAVMLPYVMFRYEITCNNPAMQGVVVVHRELESEVYTPFVDGKAAIELITGHAEIFLVDKEENRYVESVDYDMKRILNIDEFAEKCYQHNKDDKRLLVYLYDRNDAYNKTGEQVVHIRKRTLDLKDLSLFYRKRCFAALAKYYYDSFEGTKLEELLSTIRWEEVGDGHRAEFITYCILRNMFKQAAEGIRLYGYNDISRKHLLRLAQALLAEQENEENLFLLNLCNYIYTAGRYDEQVLRYLMRFYSGTVRELFGLWRAAVEMDGDDRFKSVKAELEERLIGQIVFTDVQIPGSFHVFQSFYEQKENRKLVKAYLSEEAHSYLIHGRVLPDELFDIMRKELTFEENKTCMIALLKYYSEKSSLLDEDIAFVEYNMAKLIENNMAFSFFNEFPANVTVPYQVQDKCMVEYICNPAAKVKIHYLIQGESSEEESKKEFIVEDMRNVFEGIHVKEFILFQGEVLQYYISEELENREDITESINLDMEDRMKEQASEENRYHTINLMMMSRKMRDEQTLIKLMEEYASDEAIRKSVFKPL